VTVAIEDTGCGIDSDVIDRVFEPFFTTKKDGIGMGLAICKSIIDARRGARGANRSLRKGANSRSAYLNDNLRLGRGGFCASAGALSNNKYTMV
jgi:K+-sensing histidine kinase KdpD